MVIGADRAQSILRIGSEYSSIMASRCSEKGLLALALDLLAHELSVPDFAMGVETSFSSVSFVGEEAMML